MFHFRNIIANCRLLSSTKTISPFFLFMSSESTSCGVLKEGEDPKSLSKDDWKKRLTPLEYSITRQADTERPFSGAYVNHFEKGTYVCTCCGTELFESDAKFKTSCGWPAFSSVKDEELVKTKTDTSYNMLRTEVLCNKCNAHLGHVFDDGPKPTGERYCINSSCLKFKKK